MAPKRAKVCAARAPKAAAKAAAASTMEDVLGDNNATVGSARKRRQLCRRDTEEKVRRCISTHFPQVPQAEISSVVVDGRTLLDTVTDDMRSGRNARLGKRYWEELQAKFQFSTDEGKNLVVKDATLPVGDDLRLSLESALETNAAKRSLGRMTTVLQHRGDMNQREVAGLILALPRIVAAGNSRASMDSVHIELAKLFVRCCWGRVAPS